jgi:hypothetical protein
MAKEIIPKPLISAEAADWPHKTFLNGICSPMLK